MRGWRICGRWGDGGRQGDGARTEGGWKKDVRVVGGADPYGWGAKVDAVDGRSAGEKAHSSSTAPRSPFSGRRRQEQAGGQICLLRWEKVAAEG